MENKMYQSQSFGLSVTPAVDLHADVDARQNLERTSECNLWLPV